LRMSRINKRMLVALRRYQCSCGEVVNWVPAKVEFAGWSHDGNDCHPLHEEIL